MVGLVGLGLRGFTVACRTFRSMATPLYMAQVDNQREPSHTGTSKGCRF